MTATEQVLAGKYPAKEHARKVAQYIASQGGPSDGVIYLESQKFKLNEV
jgi:Xaa-Pro dipeptidase